MVVTVTGCGIIAYLMDRLSSMKFEKCTLKYHELVGEYVPGVMM